MKIIFLDIDGVLNTTRTTRTVPGTLFTGVSSKLVRRFQDLVRRSKAKVVLSSTWRIDPYQVLHLKKQGLEFYDYTPILHKYRGIEIKQWLDDHPTVEQYVILDDNSDMLDSQLRNFVQTDDMHGLTETIAYRAEYILSYGPQSIKG